MNKKKVYELLEDKMLKYSDLAEISVKDNGEDFVNLSNLEWLKTRQLDKRMERFTKNNIYVRETIKNRLQNISKDLQRLIPGAKLEIVYGYRALEIQESLYQKFYTELKKKFKTEEELIEGVHKLIAVPEVSGHPTGGAIDLQIILDDIPLNMGTKIWEFVEDAYTFSPFIKKEDWRNRQLLRRLMTKAGFAPFDGEWWHFSYGDKEWAKYYNEPYAIYEQIRFKV